jgi:hypothetical protein
MRLKIILSQIINDNLFKRNLEEVLIRPKIVCLWRSKKQWQKKCSLIIEVDMPELARQLRYK